MKKLFIFLLIASLLFILSSCGGDPEGVKHFGLIEIKEIDSYTYLCYDPDTNIVYHCVHTAHKSSVNEYYVIGEDGKPEIAILGKNYFK